MVKVFVLLCPFAIISLISDKTSWFFKSWFRAFLSLLVVQVFISIILLITFSINYSDDLFSKLLYVGSIYALIKANSFVRELIGGVSTHLVNGFSGVKSMFLGGM